MNHEIPRRPRIAVAVRRVDRPEHAPVSMRPTLVSVLNRLWVWTVALIGLVAANLADRIRFRHSRPHAAVRLKEMLQRMGGTGIKIGQQLGLRADIIPIEYCDELTTLLDQVPPIASAVAMQIIEREVGRPLADIFASFDPEPIGSGSIGCVYQAHLFDGRKVAVKVRRPGIELEMRSDLKVIELLAKGGEALSLIPGGSSRYAVRELTRMLLDELDYHLEAQQTEVFGREAAKYGVVSVPAVLHELSGREVLVTEFVEGIFLHEILNAMEDADQTTWEALKAEGYDPVAISKRLARMIFWQMYESDMFHADPHPANIVVKPDNSITLIDFGVVGALSKQTRRALQGIFRHYDDPHQMARAIIATQQPLPYIDVDQYAQELYYLVRDQKLAMTSKAGKWYEKSSGALWAKAAEIGREYKVRLNPELLRYMRTSFLGDAILIRLNPALNMAEEFKACYVRFLAEQRRRDIDKVTKNWRPLLGETLRRVTDLVDLVGLELERRRHIVERPTYRYALRVEKSAFSAAAAIRTLVWSSAWLGIFAGARAAQRAIAGREAGSLVENVTWAVSNPFVLAFLAVGMLVTFRKVTRRLDEPDFAGR